MQVAEEKRDPATLVLRAVGIATVVIATLGIIQSFRYATSNAHKVPQYSTTRLTNWTMTTDDGSTSTVALPADVTDLPPGAHVTLATTRHIRRDDFLYFSSRYTPYVISLDGTVLAEYGEEGSFPFYAKDPPPDTSIVDLGVTEEGDHTITIQYWVPQRYRSLLLKVPEMGTLAELRTEVFLTMGFSLFFSVTLAVLGLTLIFVSTLVPARAEHKAFFWLGALFSLMGMWCFGECDLSCLILPRPLFLHLLTYVGLYGLIVPISELTPLVLGEDTVYTNLSRGITRAFAAIAIIGQLTGIWPFSQRLIPFYVVALITFSLTVLFSYVTIYRQVGHATRVQEAYLASSTALSIFMILEMLDYNFWHTVTEMTFAEIGMFSFTIILILLSVVLIRGSIKTRNEREVLAARYDMAVHALESSRDQYQYVIASEQELRRQRHDFKHQIATIRGYCQAGERERLRSFLASIEEAVPSGPMRVCDNDGVNSVVLYYMARGKRIGVQSDVLLDIPEDLSIDFTSDLCVIVGNLLENAVAANSVEQGAPGGNPAGAADTPQKWVRMRSTHVGQTLFITEENSYWNVKRDATGNFVSTKDHTGIGLSSLQTLAQRYGGTASFDASDGVFVSRVSIQTPRD